MLSFSVGGWVYRDILQIVYWRKVSQSRSTEEEQYFYRMLRERSVSARLILLSLPLIVLQISVKKRHRVYL